MISEVMLLLLSWLLQHDSHIVIVIISSSLLHGIYHNQYVLSINCVYIIILRYIISWCKKYRAKQLAYALETEAMIDTVMQRLCASIKLKKAAKQLFKDRNKYMSGVRRAILNMLHLLINPPTDEDEFKTAYLKARDDLAKAIAKVSGGRWKEYINLSDLLYDFTKGLVCKNYAPNDDCNERNKGMHNRIPRTNSCILTYAKVLINSLLKEAGSSDRFKGAFDAVAFVDACVLALEKDRYQAEIKEFIWAAGISLDEFYLISIMLIGFQAIWYGMNNNGNPMPLLLASANARDHLIDTTLQPNVDGIIITSWLFYCSVVPHGECFVNTSYLLQWDEKAFKQFGNSFVWFYSKFGGHLAVIEQLIDDGSEIVFRFSGWLSLSEEEKADIRACRRINSEMMRLAAIMYRAEWKFSALTNTADIELFNRLKASKGKGSDKTLIEKLKKRYAPFEMAKLASTLSDLGWKFGSLVDARDIEMYNRLKGSQAGGDDVLLLAMLQEKTPHYSIDSAFNGETLDEEDLQVLGGKYSHVIRAASEFAILEDDGSNAQSVFEHIDDIFTSREEGDKSQDKTKDSRWRSFEKRCAKKGWTDKFALLSEQKRNKGATKMADNVARKRKELGTGESSRATVARMKPTAEPSWATL